MRLDAKILLCLSVLWAAPAQAQQSPPLPLTPPPAFTQTIAADHPLVGKIWSVADRAFIDPDQLIRRAAAARAVLLGETHDNRDHHALQAWVVRGLIQAGKRPEIAFEMLDQSQDAALTEHLTRRPRDAAGLGDAVGWAKTGWPDWDWYAPIAQAALDAGLPIRTANLSRNQTRLTAKGVVPKEFKGKVDFDAPLDAETRLAFEADIRESHCNMLPESALPSMIRVQRARDAVMAQAIADAPRSAVLIAGSGHVRADRAVPRILAESGAPGPVFTLAMLEVQADWTDPAVYAEGFDADFLPFDAVWFTPKASREDQCEAFRKHMEKKAG